MKKQIDIDIALEQLKGINPNMVEGLSYEKLMSKINLAQRERAPKVLLMGVTLSLVALLAFNFIALENTVKPKQNNLVKELGLMSNNSIYSEL